MEKYPQLNNIADYNVCLDPIIRNEAIAEDMKITLWHAKVMLDYNIKSFQEEINNRIKNRTP